MQRQDRIALVLPDGPEMAVAFLGVTACAIAAPLNPLYQAEEMEAAFTELRPRALIAQAGMGAAAVHAARARNVPVIELYPIPGAAAGVFTLRGEAFGTAAPPQYIQEENVILLLNTSGTTSLPKLIPLIQRNLCRYLHDANSLLCLTPQDRCLEFLPMCSVGLPLGVEVAIMEGNQALPVGETGEIVARGERVLRRYANDADTVPRVNGWFRTGDIRHIDAEGYLFVTGRVKELINRGARKSSPAKSKRLIKYKPLEPQKTMQRRCLLRLCKPYLDEIVIK